MRPETLFAHPANDNGSNKKMETFEARYAETPMGTVYYNSVEDLEHAFISLAHSYAGLAKAFSILEETRNKLAKLVREF